MLSKVRVLRAFRRGPGLPDRMPLQFDLCRALTDAFGKKLGIPPDYALSYYEDLTSPGPPRTSRDSPRSLNTWIRLLPNSHTN